ARVNAQASLPRWIANAWTQPENIGVSRHPSLLDGPCVACLYMPSGRRKNLDELVAESIGLADPVGLREVRALLHTGQPVGAAFIASISAKTGAPSDLLRQFEDQPLRAFYSRAVCGGLLIGFSGGNARVEVPMAFQSAAAGIMLAAELIADAGS